LPALPYSSPALRGMSRGGSGEKQQVLLGLLHCSFQIYKFINLNGFVFPLYFHFIKIADFHLIFDVLQGKLADDNMLSSLILFIYRFQASSEIDSIANSRIVKDLFTTKIAYDGLSSVYANANLKTLLTIGYPLLL
jgi:hypothetical protein